MLFTWAKGSVYFFFSVFTFFRSLKLTRREGDLSPWDIFHHIYEALVAWYKLTFTVYREGHSKSL